MAIPTLNFTCTISYPLFYVDGKLNDVIKTD